MSCDIMAVKRRLTAVYPFFGSMAAGAGYIETEGTGKVSNDGMNILYDPEYMAGLSDGQQMSVLAHELCHIAFRHASRGAGNDPAIWDDATDAVINQMLKRDGLELIPSWIDYPEAIGYDAEQYYEILLSGKLDMDLIDGQMAGCENPAGGNGKEGAGSDQGDDDDETAEDPDDATEENDQELLQEEAEGEGSEDDEEALVESKESDSGNAVRQDERVVEKPEPAPPLIDWRLLMQDTINYGVDWSYTNAVLEDGMVRPVLEEIPVPETEIVLDTSWSVDDELLRNFLRECRSILSFSKMKAGCFDTVFYGFHDIRTEKDIEEMDFRGGGGTDFDAAAEAFTLRVDNRIIFTDGQAPMPEKTLKAIWVVYGDEEIDPPGGKVIYIRPEQLRSVY